MEQNRQNERLRCGLTGSRWGYDYSAYFNYCMGNPASAYNSARRARDAELGACKATLASRRRPVPIRPEGLQEPELDIVIDNDGSSSFCRNFARQSVRQARQARVEGCGFRGSRWSVSRIAQVRLCLEIGERAATRLLNRRAARIKRCVADRRRDRGFAGLDGGGYCEFYARASVRQARLARQMDCGYDGPRWQTSFGRHLRWCNRVPRRRSEREIRRRERLLYRCE
jgi:hypothetical protein